MENLGFGGSPNMSFGGGAQSTGNPYLQPVIDGQLGDTVRHFNMAVSPSIRSAMVRSGSFGNSGLEQMAGEAERQLATTLGRQAGELRYQDYWADQNFGRQLFQDAQMNNLSNFGMGMNLLGTLNQFNQQDLSNATTVQNQPLNYWSAFSNGANGIGNGFGTSSGTMNMPGSPVMGALGGWQLGSAFANAMTPRNSMGNPIYNPATNTGGWSGTSLGGHFGGWGTGGD